MKSHILLLASAVFSGLSQATPPRALADNEVLVSAGNVYISDGLKRPRLVIAAPRGERAVIVGEESGRFRTKIQCRDAQGLLEMLAMTPRAEREAAFISNIREEHQARMQAQGSKRNIPPLLSFTFSQAEGAFNQEEGLERGYRALAQYRMQARANEYKRAADLCVRLN